MSASMRAVSFAGLVSLLLGACNPGDGAMLAIDGKGARTANAMTHESVFGDTTSDTDKGPGRPGLIANPTLKDLMVAGPLGDRALGAANAPVTVIEYASLTCPHCRAFHINTYAGFKREYVDTGKVRYILREFPIGRSSGNAWLVTRCSKGAQFFKLFDLFLRKQGMWVSQNVRLDAIYKVASQVGISRETFDKCLKNQKIIEAVKWVKNRGRQLGVTGTPTFFFNAKKVRAVLTIEDMRKLIDPMLKGQIAAR